MLNVFLQSDAAVVENLIVPDSVQKARFAEAITRLADEEFVRGIGGEMLNWLVWTGIKFLISLVIYYIGRWLLGKLIRLIDAVMTRREVEVSLHSFILTAIKTLGYVLLVLIIVSVLGFNSSSFIAVLASMGLAIGMALSGTLQNFAGGVMILVLRPYRVGDYIEAQGVSGTVSSISLFNTVIHTTDKKTIYIPNNAISTSIINNYSTSTTRRCSWKISVSYGDNYDTIREAMYAIIHRDGRALETPAPYVRIDVLADSAVIIEARAWVLNSEYWDFYDAITEAFYKELPQHGANFPFPQLDVHLTQDKK
ncbi:MAG: mechanosensitive ion channel family protein [Alistipes sp.]|nr:mechanosensitive ion channel family protein [Alistipes sp.]MBQ5617747.1 mechanosensitive ion channel family protein [Alistipes sp.]MBQ5703576.1 mechanosensitive ion channel family protein [Alistipes sp.]MBQ6580555.1 mechanosensitive ion channel family protein [Alistipes sp.]